MGEKKEEKKKEVRFIETYVSKYKKPPEHTRPSEQNKKP